MTKYYYDRLFEVADYRPNVVSIVKSVNSDAAPQGH